MCEGAIISYLNYLSKSAQLDFYSRKKLLSCTIGDHVVGNVLLVVSIFRRIFFCCIFITNKKIVWGFYYKLIESARSPGQITDLVDQQKGQGSITGGVKMRFLTTPSLGFWLYRWSFRPFLSTIVFTLPLKYRPFQIPYNAVDPLRLMT